MRGKFPTNKLLFDPKITKTERKNMKKKKQITSKTLSESSSTNSPSIEKPIVIDNMVDREGGGNKLPKRTLGDYATNKDQSITTA